MKGDAIIMIDRFLHWLRRPSTILSFIVVAACIMAVGHFLDANNMFDGLRNFTAI